jgi:hypothetical protein
MTWLAYRFSHGVAAGPVVISYSTLEIAGYAFFTRLM